MTLTDNNDELIFEEDGIDETLETVTPWKMMIVDDVEDIHQVTRMIFEDYVFDGRNISFLSAYTGKEARQLMEEHPDTAVILLDVVMETDHAGLEVVQFRLNRNWCDPEPRQPESVWSIKSICYANHC